MILIRKYHHFINRFIGSDTPRAYLLTAAAAILSFSILGTLLVWIGAPAMNGRPWDLPLFLDTAWRIDTGQVPHRDFYSHIGSFIYYLTLLGMKLSHPCVSSIVYGTVTLMAVLAPIAMAILWRRTSALYAFIFTAFLALMVVSPRPLGDSYDSIDYAMTYNRFGEAFLALIAVFAFLSPRPGQKQRWLDVMDSVLVGLLLAVLWFNKLSYFTVGVSFLGLAVVLRLLNLSRALLCALYTTAFVACFLAVSGIPLSDMLADFRIMLGAQGEYSRMGGLIIHFAKQIWLLPILLLLTWECRNGKSSVGTTEGRWAALRDWLLPMAIFGSAVLLLATNCQIEEMPLLAVAALLGAECIRRQSASLGTETSFCAGRNLAALCVLLFFLMPTMGSDLKTIRQVVIWAKKKDYRPTGSLQTTALADFRFSSEGRKALYSDLYIQKLEEGIALIRRHDEKGMRLMVKDGGSGFHFALGLQPAKGGVIYWADNLINRHSHPQLAHLLGDSTHILIERSAPDPRDTYGAEWDALNLETLESTPRFILLKLKQPAPAR